jgi:hypothetical protein
VATASPSKVKSYAAGSYSVSAVNDSVKSSSVGKLTVTDPTVCCRELKGSPRPLVPVYGAGAISPTVDKCEGCGTSQNEVDWSAEIGTDTYETQPLRVLLTTTAPGSALDDITATVETPVQELVALSRHPKADLVPPSGSKFTGSTFVSPVVEIANSSLTNTNAPSSGDLRVELPYRLGSVPKGAQLIVVGLQSVAGSMVWSNLGVTELSAGSGEISAELPGFGDYTVMAVS